MEEFRRPVGGSPQFIWITTFVVRYPSSVSLPPEEIGTVFGLGAALQGESTVKDGRVEQCNFGGYRVATS